MKQIQLADDVFATVDDSDFERVSRYNWTLDNNGYAVRMVQVARKDGRRTRRKILMHRYILSAPSHLEVDHIDGDPLNNSRSNIRLCTRSQNCANRQKTRGTSRYKGVSWKKDRQLWQANITKDGRTYYLGRYASEEEAAQAYDTAAVRLFGEFAAINLEGGRMELQ